MRWFDFLQPLRQWRRELSLGQRGERAAERYLRRKGYIIVARGQRMRLGEIDLIAVDRGTLVFVEVKTRQSHDLLETPARFDVVAVTWPESGRRPEIEHFENAFEATGNWQMFS